MRSCATTCIWEFAAFDLPFARRGASELRYVVHYDAEGDADGFATYRFKEDFGDFPEGEVRVKEVWADDAGAYAGLWRYLLDLDLARTFRHWNVPLDEPLRHLVTDARAVETELTDNLYLRVVDVEAALKARKYAAGVDLVIEVDDPLLPANSGCYRLVTDGDPDGSSAEVTRVTSAAGPQPGHPRARHDLPRRRPAPAAAPGTTGHRAHPGAVAAASAAFGWHRAPWCPDMF